MNMQVCPYCGHALNSPLRDGLSHCSHCSQVFDSSHYNQLLSAAWHVRKDHFSIEKMKHQLKLDDDFCILVYTYINDYGYSHEEFIKLLKKLGVANKSYIDYSV